MTNNLWQSEPEEGDVLKTKPIRVSKIETVLGTNPTNWGQETVKIKKNNLRLVISEEEYKAIEQNKGPFKIRDVKGHWPAKVLSKNSGRLTVELLDNTKLKEHDKADLVFESPNRQEKITWDGTPQEAGSENTKKRQEVFNEEDSRGSKNDLLDGHL